MTTGSTIQKLHSTYIAPSSEANATLAAYGTPALERSVSALDLLRRPEVGYDAVRALAGDSASDEVAEQVEMEAKYQGYIDKQRVEVERVRKLEEYRIPIDFAYADIAGLRNEARQKLEQFRPLTLGQASRIYGVTPTDVAILLVQLQKSRK